MGIVCERIGLQEAATSGQREESLEELQDNKMGIVCEKIGLQEGPLCLPNIGGSMS
jgi:hypothetical protein